MEHFQLPLGENMLRTPRHSEKTGKLWLSCIDLVIDLLRSVLLACCSSGDQSPPITHTSTQNSEEASCLLRGLSLPRLVIRRASQVVSLWYLTPEHQLNRCDKYRNVYMSCGDRARLRCFVTSADSTPERTQSSAALITGKYSSAGSPRTLACPYAGYLASQTG